MILCILSVAKYSWYVGYNNQQPHERGHFFRKKLKQLSESSFIVSTSIQTNYPVKQKIVGSIRIALEPSIS